MKSESFVDMIQHLKRCVNSMVLERDQLAGVQESALPSPIWTEMVSVFSYLMSLSPEDFRNIRFHTGLINGSSWRYWHPYPEPDPEIEAESLGYSAAVKDVPEKYWIGEPPTPGIPRPLGVEYRGHIINDNVSRFQRCVSTLYHANALSSVSDAKQKQLVLEVGGGYGGLAHGLGTILGDQATYLLIDLPEMLLFQGAYLAVNNRDKSIYVYDSETFHPEFFVRNVYDYDFVLLPNYALNKLYLIKGIAFLINMQSFQELTEQQLQDYLDFAVQRVTYCMYSDNLDRHPHNNSPISVTDLLESYFDLYPSPQYYNELYRNADQGGFGCYKRYCGFPKGSGRALPDLAIPELPTAPKVSVRRRLVRTLVPRLVRRAVRSWLSEIVRGG